MVTSLFVDLFWHSKCFVHTVSYLNTVKQIKLNLLSGGAAFPTGGKSLFPFKEKHTHCFFFISSSSGLGIFLRSPILLFFSVCKKPLGSAPLLALFSQPQLDYQQQSGGFSLMGSHILKSLPEALDLLQNCGEFPWFCMVCKCANKLYSCHKALLSPSPTYPTYSI